MGRGPERGLAGSVQLTIYTISRIMGGDSYDFARGYKGQT